MATILTYDGRPLDIGKAVSFIGKRTKTWTGLYPQGRYVWQVGDHVYYSNGDTQYELNVDTSTWTAKTWNISIGFYGNCVWTDGTDTYLSHGTYQYVFDPIKVKWIGKRWNGLSSITGWYIWKYGNAIYYSDAANQYELDVSTSTWSAKTWTGLTSFDGRDVWSDKFGRKYYSKASAQYALTVNSWSTKSWSGVNSYYGRYVWEHDGYIYLCDTDGHQKVLNSDSTKWISTNFGISQMAGDNVWELNGKTYYSNSYGTQYELLFIDKDAYNFISYT